MIMYKKQNFYAKSRHFFHLFRTSFNMNSQPESYNRTNRLQVRDGQKMICDIKATLGKEGTKRPEVVLDIGCGSGNLTEFLFEKLHPRRLVAMDLSQGMADFAQEKKPRNWPIEYYQASIADPFPVLSEKLRLSEGSVDLIVANYVFHWLSEEDLQTAMQNLYKLLKPNGRFYLMVFGRFDALTIFQESGLTDKWRDYLLNRLAIQHGAPQDGKVFGFDVKSSNTELETFNRWDKLCLENKLWMEDCNFTYTRHPYDTVEDTYQQMRIGWWNALVEDDRRKEFEADQEAFMRRRLFNRLLSVEKHRRTALDIVELDNNPTLHLPYQYIVVSGKKFL